MGAFDLEFLALSLAVVEGSNHRWGQISHHHIHSFRLIFRTFGWSLSVHPPSLAVVFTCDLTKIQDLVNYGAAKSGNQFLDISL